MTKVKIVFSIAIMLLLGFLIFGAVNKSEVDKVNVFNKVEDISKGTIREYSLVEAKTYTCEIEKPENRTIIIRIDDIARWNNLDLMKRMVTDILYRNYGTSLGIIPHGIEDNRDLVRWIQKIKEDPRVELSQHGYQHTTEEFVSLNYEDSKQKIELGIEDMIRLFGEKPINFIPPYNVQSRETIEALKSSGFKTFSGEQNEYIVSPDFVEVGYTTTTFAYSTGEFNYAESVLESCKNSLDSEGMCVIMVHPQDFTENGKVNEEKYIEFVKVLEGLKDLNADVVNFREAFCKEY